MEGSQAMSNYLLGIDSGGTMTKTALFSATGEEIASQFSPVTMLFPQKGFTERNPLDMWDATCNAIRSILQSTGVSANEIAALCATGYGSGLFCVDAHGIPTYNGIVSTDSRAGGIIEKWDQAGFTSVIHDSIGQKNWPGQSLVLLGWLLQHRPDVVEKTAHVYECKDYTKMRLTGTISTDYTDAALGGLLDLHRSNYATELFQTLGLEPWIDKLPPLAHSADIAGVVTPEAAEQTGLIAGTQVITGAIDVVCSSIGSGVVNRSQLSVVAGTWGIHTAVRDGAPQRDPVPLAQMPYLIPDTFLALEAGATSASNLEWSCNHVFDAEYVAAEAAGETIYERCGRMVESRMDNPSDVLFLPYLFGGPAHEQAGFVGLGARHERADLVYAVYEGIVYAHKRNIDLLMETSGDSPPTVIRLAGGAARSRVWAQMFADVLGMPVEVAEGTEFGALGASICASVGIGWSDSYKQAVDRMIRIRERFEPDLSKRDRHDARYQQFLRVGEALADSWQTPELEKS